MIIKDIPKKLLFSRSGSDMTADITELDAHEQPTDELRAFWKSYAKADHRDLKSHPDIDDPRIDDQRSNYCTAGFIPAEKVLEGFSSIVPPDSIDPSTIKDVPILYHPSQPGM